MQERRTAVRISHQGRMQYCAEGDLAPRDGRLVNLSDRGVSVLLREGAQEGQRVTLNFQLPGESDPVTATGVVRWAGEKAGRHGHQAGLEWFPLDEGARRGLDAFFKRTRERSAAVSAGPGLQTRMKAALQRVALPLILLCGIVLALYAFALIHSLRGKNRQLTATVIQRDAVIQTMQGETTRLRQDLETAQTHLAQTSAEVAELDEQAKRLGVEVGQLTQSIDQVQRAYVDVRQDRDRLMQQVLDLEQERTALTKRLSSIEELRQAIRETIEARKAAQQAQRELFVQARRESDLKELETGNRGYLIRDGSRTARSSTVRINVLEPEPLQ